MYKILIVGINIKFQNNLHVLNQKVSKYSMEMTQNDISMTQDNFNVNLQVIWL